MADINYMNPQAMRPEIDYKPKGLAAGYRYQEQEQEYLRQLAIQDEFRKLQLMQDTQKAKEFMGGAELRGLEGQLKQRQIEGQLPYAGELAGAEAQAKQAGFDFERKTKFSPEATQEALRKITQGKTDDEIKNMTRDMTVGAQIAHQAIAIQQSQGELAAQAFMDQQLQRMESQGIKLPPQLRDARSWAPFRDAAQHSVEQLQKLEIEKQRGANQERVANINAASNRYSADRRGTTDPNVEKRIVKLGQIVAEGGASPAQKKELEQLVSIKWFDFLKSAMVPPAQIPQMKKEFFGAYNLQTNEPQDSKKTKSLITLPNGVKFTPMD